MTELLDKTGLQYFFLKLCNIFVKKTDNITYTVKKDDITNALGYTPVDPKSVETDLFVVRNNYASLESALDKYANVQDEIKQVVDRTNSSLTTISAYVDKASNKVNQLQSVIDGQNASINNIATKYDKLDGSLSKVESKLNATDGSILNIASRVVGQSSVISTLNQYVTDLAAAIELKAAKDDVESSIKLLADDVKANLELKASMLDVLTSINATSDYFNSQLALKASIDDVEAQIEASVIDDNGNLKSSIKLNADNITIGTLGSNIAFGGTLQAPSGTIGGWTIEENQLSSGTDIHNIIVSPDVIKNGDSWEFNADGSGHLASGAILWDKGGRLFVQSSKPIREDDPSYGEKLFKLSPDEFTIYSEGEGARRTSLTRGEFRMYDDELDTGVVIDYTGKIIVKENSEEKIRLDGLSSKLTLKNDAIKAVIQPTGAEFIDDYDNKSTFSTTGILFVDGEYNGKLVASASQVKVEDESNNCSALSPSSVSIHDEDNNAVIITTTGILIKTGSDYKTILWSQIYNLINQ